MNLVDEENLSFGERCEERYDVGLFLYRRPARRLDRRAHLMSDDGRDGGFSESRRSIKKYMFEVCFADFCGLYCDAEMFLE